MRIAAFFACEKIDFEPGRPFPHVLNAGIARVGMDTISRPMTLGVYGCVLAEDGDDRKLIVEARVRCLAGWSPHQVVEDLSGTFGFREDNPVAHVYMPLAAQLPQTGPYALELSVRLGDGAPIVATWPLTVRALPTRPRW